MDLEKMTPQQLRDLADKKEQELANKISHVGYLKEDLYNFHSDSGSNMEFHLPWGNFWLKTKEQKDKLIKSFEGRFELALRKGAKFVRYAEEKLWYDEDYGVEGMNDDWAQAYLENIEEQK